MQGEGERERKQKQNEHKQLPFEMSLHTQTPKYMKKPNAKKGSQQSR